MNNKPMKMEDLVHDTSFFVTCRGAEALQMNNKPMKMEDLVYDTSFVVPCRGAEALWMNNKPMKMEDLVYDDQIYQRLQQQEEGLETVLKMEVFDEDQILPPG